MFKAKFAGNKKVEVESNGFIFKTDLPATLNGDDTALNPFDSFLASLTACAATYVLFFLDKHSINKEGISVQLAPVFNEEGLIQKADITVCVPNTFPADKEAGLIKMASHCKVGLHLNFPHDVIIARQ